MAGLPGRLRHMEEPLPGQAGGSRVVVRERDADAAEDQAGWGFGRRAGLI